MIRSIQLGPYKFFADDATRPGIEILENGFNYEKHVVEELRKWIPSSFGFLDIGANCGIHTLIARSINSGMKIVCAEVSKFNLDLLLRNISFNRISNVFVLPFALARHPMILHANSCEENTCVSVGGEPDSTEYPKLVAALPIDMMNIGAIDLIKIDVEGFEIEVLRGADSLIRRNNPKIIFEFCPEITHRSGVTPTEFLDWFFNRNYRLTMLDYIPGARKECSSAEQVMDQLAKTSKWITDIIAIPY